MITVNKISKHTGISAHAVRYYSKIGLLKPRRNPDNGYRSFDRSDVVRVRFIRQAQKLGFSLKEVGEILKITDQVRSACHKVREMLQQRIAENRDKLRELGQLQKRMEHALTAWQTMPDADPGDDSVCRLIESVDGLCAAAVDCACHQHAHAA